MTARSRTERRHRVDGTGARSRRGARCHAVWSNARAADAIPVASRPRSARISSGVAACGMNRVGRPSTLRPARPGRRRRSRRRSSSRCHRPHAVLGGHDRAVGGGVARSSPGRAVRSSARPTPSTSMPVGLPARRPPSRRSPPACRWRAGTPRRPDRPAARARRAATPWPTSCSSTLPGATTRVADGDRAVVGERHRVVRASGASSWALDGASTRMPGHPRRASPCRTRRGGSARRGR